MSTRKTTFLLSGPRVGTPVRGVAFTPVISGNHVYATVGHNPEQGTVQGDSGALMPQNAVISVRNLSTTKSAPNEVIPHKRIQAL